MEYVRRTYGVPAKRGMRISWTWRGDRKNGVITSATSYVFVRFDGDKRSRPLHPCEDGLVYGEGNAKP